MSKVAVVVGHSEKQQGAANKSFEMTEYRYNSVLAQQLKQELEVNGLECIIIERETLSDLPHKVNSTKADICISLHCNAFNHSVSGCETLYYLNSYKGKQLAELVQKASLSVLDNRDRGTKEITMSERGGFLLSHTRMPCIISEPFFIDSDSDYMIAMDKHAELAKAYAKAIKKFF